MSLPRITAEGGLVRDPELRFVSSDRVVANFTIACKDRVPDGQGGFKDGDPCFLRVAVWGKAAEHIAESARQGDLVMVSGRLVQKEYETAAGEKRSSMECVADTVGIALTFGVAKTGRAGGTGVQRSSAPAEDDPWAKHPTTDEPPF